MTTERRDERDEKDEKRRRLDEALRENLKRRKAQARARAAADVPPSPDRRQEPS